MVAKLNGITGVKIRRIVQLPMAAPRSIGADAPDPLRIGRLHLRRGNLPKALPLLEQSLRYCREANVPHLFPRIAGALGTAYSLERRLADAVPLLTQAVEQTAVRMMAHRASAHLSLAEVKMLAGSLQEASALASAALALGRRHQQRGQEAYALRLLAEVAVRQTPPQRTLAQGHYRQAIALAKTFGMRPLVAHCNRGLGTLYRCVGERLKADEHLATATRMYREMDMLFWLEKPDPEIKV